MNKKLFGALALTVALAACTNEDELVFSTENGNDAALANRPVIGNVELSTTPATRAGVVDGTWGKLVYVTSDAIGAALVDQPNFSTQTGWGKGNNNWGFKTWTYSQYVADYKPKIDGKEFLFTQTVTESEGTIKNSPASFYDICGGTYKVDDETTYTVANAIHTNYGYTFNGETWTTEASLVEGHYMFYFPYNAKNSTRMPVNVEIPNRQTCTDGSSAIEAFYKGTSPVAVDVKFLQKPAAGEKIKVAATPNHLFAFPQIKIKNDFNGYIYNVKYNEDGTVNEIESAKSTSTSKTKTSMTIQRVELVYTGNDTKLWNKATINASKLAAAVNAGWEKNKFMTPSYTSAVVDDVYVTAYNKNTAVYPYLPIAKNNKQTLIENYTQVFVFDVNKELAIGEEYAFNAIMPAENYGADQLKARVYVKIGTQNYIMMVANSKENKPYGQVLNRYTDNVSGIFAFAPGKPIELVRGERYPIIEYNSIVNAEGETEISAKTSAGNIMTISLEDLSAFEAGSNTGSVATRGFETKEALVAHMLEATRGTALTEVSNAGNAKLGEHEIAFDKNITLDAELVDAIYNNVHYGDMAAHMILNYTNLAIANDVKVSATYTEDSNKKYHIYELTGKEKTIKVWYRVVKEEGLGNNIINTNGSALVSGINEVSANVELKKKSGDAGVGIVFLSGSASIKKAADTFRIVVLSGTLAVNDVCGAQINTKNGSAVVVNANLTNAANNFENGTIITVKDVAKTIAGSVNNNTVSVSLKAWPTSVPTASKINKVIVNPDQADVLTLEQANFNVFQVNTVVELGTNVTSIRSNADVDLTKTKITELKGTRSPETTWIGGNGNIVVTGSNSHKITKIVKGDSCDIVTK